MNGHSRSFVKLVQHDLLALSDTCLFDLIHHWVDTAVNADDSSEEILHNTRSALGYTFVGADVFHATVWTSEQHLVGQWHTPTPSHLRSLLTDMDVNQFVACVIPLAWMSLHATYPEWGEGLIFHAHLANYLRQKEQEIRKG